MESFQKLFDIHPLTVKDCLVIHEDGALQRQELFDKYHAISISESKYLQGSNILQTIDVFLIIMEQVVISVHHEPSDTVELVARQAIKNFYFVRWQGITFGRN